MRGLTSALFFATLFWVCKVAVADPLPTLMSAPISTIEIPATFNSNSQAYVLAEGRFRNGCYRWVGADVQQKPNWVTEIRGYASVSQGMCIQMIIPFHAQIPLGQLASGTYELHVVRPDGSYIAEHLTIQ